MDFKNDGPEARRSRYEADTLSIIINLEHPAVASALGKATSVEDVNFLRIVYEIAFVEYSLAFARELTDQDPDMPADDLLYEIGTTLNRIASKAVLLY